MENENIRHIFVVDIITSEHSWKDGPILKKDVQFTLGQHLCNCLVTAKYIESIAIRIVDKDPGIPVKGD